jgi:hypothetical protein
MSFKRYEAELWDHVGKKVPINTEVYSILRIRLDPLDPTQDIDVELFDRSAGQRELCIRAVHQMLDMRANADNAVRVVIRR